MKGMIYRIITACLLAGWMLIIFLFSHQPANTSSQISGGFCTEMMTTINEKMNLELSEDRINSIAEQMEYPVRKMAHMAEYAVLGVFAFFFFCGYENILWKDAKKKKEYGLAFLLAVFYAATDELHQLFVTGRAGRISDVFIDATGAAIGLLIILLFCTILTRKRAK